MTGTRHVALLRGVNVGGKHIVAMAELRRLFESAGHSSVSTYIQSGNVIFTNEVPVTGAVLERAIEARFGLKVAIILRKASDLQRVLGSNPFPGADTTKLHVGFVDHAPAPEAITNVDVGRFAPEELAIKGREIYLHLPQGMARAKLPPHLDRRLGVPITIRNWNTVTKLVELARERR